MSLTDLLADGSALYADVRAYRKQLKRKRVARFLQATKHSEQHHLDDRVVAAITAMRSSAETTLQLLKSKLVPGHAERFTSVARREQADAVGYEPPVSPADERVNTDLVWACTALGCSIVGTLVFQPLAFICIPYFAYSSIPMIKNAYENLKKGKISVDALSVLVIFTGLANGYYVVLGLANLSYYLSTNLLQKVKRDAKSKLVDVFRQQPRTAWLLTNGVEVEVPFADLKEQDIVVVNAGGIIPADGTITQGMASIDQHILTGESQPAEKGVGETVFASTTVLSGRICVAIERAGEETIVAQIGQILNKTADFKSAMQLRSEEITDKTIVPTLLLSGAALPFIGPLGSIAILNAHYKYKMGIVAPISILTFLDLMSEHQILIKDGRTLDLLNQVDTIVFDKTGTLTEEEPTFERVHTCSAYSENDVLTYAAAAETKQTHPIARAILRAAEDQRLSLPEIAAAAYRIGYGLTVSINGWQVRVGSGRFMEMEEIALPPQMQDIWETCHTQGHSLVMVAVGDALIGAVELRPTLRPEAQEIIATLRQRHNITSTYIISGDHEMPTRRLAQQLGIDHYFAATLPENKADLIERLQAEGRFVCFVGDGINDAIALKKAQVSISLRGASTVATDTAQIILMDGRLTQLVRLFDLAREYKANMNIGFASLIVPTIVGMTGALFFHFGLMQTIILGYGGLTFGAFNGVLPGIKHQQAEAANEKLLANGEITSGATGRRRAAQGKSAGDILSPSRTSNESPQQA